VRIIRRVFRCLQEAPAIALASFSLLACSIDDGEPSEPIPSPDSGAPVVAAKAGVGAVCKIATDCDSAQCFVGGMSSYCSLKCGTDTAATVCVPPVFNGVCNKQGFCRKP
jgi:hypothetical protein